MSTEINGSCNLAVVGRIEAVHRIGVVGRIEVGRIEVGHIEAGHIEVVHHIEAVYHIEVGHIEVVHHNPAEDKLAEDRFVAHRQVVDYMQVGLHNLVGHRMVVVEHQHQQQEQHLPSWYLKGRSEREQNKHRMRDKDNQPRGGKMFSKCGKNIIEWLAEQKANLNYSVDWLMGSVLIIFSLLFARAVAE